MSSSHQPDIAMARKSEKNLARKTKDNRRKGERRGREGSWENNPNLYSRKLNRNQSGDCKCCAHRW